MTNVTSADPESFVREGQTLTFLRGDLGFLVDEGREDLNTTISRVREIKIVIVINCNLITFSKVIACNCSSDISLITVIECN